jgi:phospholipid/cholesterol/gamma-HCH transport system substrate-binding protein
MNPSEVKVGAMTLGGAVVLALIVSFLGAFSIFDRGYNLEISYPAVSGLKGRKRGTLCGRACRFG